MKSAEKLGDRIRKLRELKGLTQEELAEKGDTSSQYISALERGKKNVTLEMLEKVTVALGTDMVALFSFDSSDDRPSKQSLKKLIDQMSDDEMKKVSRIISIITT